MATTPHTHGNAPPHEHADDYAGHTHDAVTPQTSPTTTAPPATAPGAASVEVGPSGGGVAARIVLTILGAAGMIAGAFLAWGGDATGTEVEFKVFYSTEVGGQSGIASSAGLVFIVLGLLALLGLAFRTGWLTRLAGALGIVAAVLVVISAYRADESITFFELGFWLCAGGSLVALIGGFLGSRERVVARSF
jgi:hypothetical protein